MAVAPRVVGGAEERIRRLHRCQQGLRHVRLAEDDRARLAQQAHDDRVLAGDVLAACPHADRRGHARDVDVFLDGDRQPVERALRLAAGARFVRRLRLCERLLAELVRERADLRLDLVGPGVEGLDDLDRTNLAAGQELLELDRGVRMQGTRHVDGLVTGRRGGGQAMAAACGGLLGTWPQASALVRGYLPAMADRRRVLEKHLYRTLEATCRTWSLLRPGDRVMVALSGGKDSYTLLYLLDRLVPRLDFSVELVAVHLDQSQPGYDGRPLVAWLEQRGGAFEVLREDTYAEVVARTAPGGTYCAVCSRLRRGILYTAEERIAELASLVGFPILPCNLCGSQEGLQREQMAALIASLERSHPHVRSVMRRALGNVRPTHLLDSEVLEAWDSRPAHVRPEVETQARPARFEAQPVRRLPLVD